MRRVVRASITILALVIIAGGRRRGRRGTRGWARSTLHPDPKPLVAVTGAEEVGLTLAGVADVQGLHEDRPLVHRRLPFPTFTRA